ncbi:MAG: hypothetical protein AUH69_00610 [Actinobacteria bacterium 13_1_40CM_4_65_12]|nr:MAG: hypothetical protein AUH69_00610 [Actinobacteria bacterium 13_1_40CM_4_65_12]
MNEEPDESAPEENPPAAPAPDYPAPPADSPPPAAAARPPRNMLPIIAAGVVVAVLVVAVIGYAAAGIAFASSRIAGTRTTYNAVVAHQNTITDEFNAFDNNLTGVNLTSATATQLKQSRAAYDTLVSQSRAAQPTIAADDASLASAQARLNDNSWLTLFSRSSLNNASAKMGHERKALAAAKAITGDLIQLGTFYQAFYDSLIDLDTLSTKAQATDFTGAAAAITTLKADIAKSIQLSSAPGLPPEMKLFLTDFQTLAVDFGKLLDAAIAGDSNGASTDLKAVDADITKIGSYDTDKMSSEIKAFYQPLIDTFNSEIAKANKA